MHPNGQHNSHSGAPPTRNPRDPDYQRTHDMYGNPYSNNQGYPMGPPPPPPPPPRQNNRESPGPYTYVGHPQNQLQNPGGYPQMPPPQYQQLQYQHLQNPGGHHPMPHQQPQNRGSYPLMLPQQYHQLQYQQPQNRAGFRPPMPHQHPQNTGGFPPMPPPQFSPQLQYQQAYASYPQRGMTPRAEPPRHLCAPHPPPSQLDSSRRSAAFTMAGYTSVEDQFLAKAREMMLPDELIIEKNIECVDRVETAAYDHFTDDYKDYLGELWLWNMLIPEEPFPGIPPENNLLPTAAPQAPESAPVPAPLLASTELSVEQFLRDLEQVDRIRNSTSHPSIKKERARSASPEPIKKKKDLSDYRQRDETSRRNTKQIKTENAPAMVKLEDRITDQRGNRLNLRKDQKKAATPPAQSENNMENGGKDGWQTRGRGKGRGRGRGRRR